MAHASRDNRGNLFNACLLIKNSFSPISISRRTVAGVSGKRRHVTKTARKLGPQNKTASTRDLLRIPIISEKRLDFAPTNKKKGAPRTGGWQGEIERARKDMPAT